MRRIQCTLRHRAPARRGRPCEDGNEWLVRSMLRRTTGMRSVVARGNHHLLPRRQEAGIRARPRKPVLDMLGRILRKMYIRFARNRGMADRLPFVLSRSDIAPCICHNPYRRLQSLRLMHRVEKGRHLPSPGCQKGIDVSRFCSCPPQCTAGGPGGPNTTWNIHTMKP